MLHRVEHEHTLIKRQLEEHGHDAARPKPRIDLTHQVIAPVRHFENYCCASAQVAECHVVGNTAPQLTPRHQALLPQFAHRLDAPRQVAGRGDLEHHADIIVIKEPGGVLDFLVGVLGSNLGLDVFDEGGDLRRPVVRVQANRIEVDEFCLPLTQQVLHAVGLLHPIAFRRTSAEDYDDVLQAQVEGGEHHHRQRSELLLTGVPPDEPVPAIGQNMPTVHQNSVSHCPYLDSS